MFTMIMNAYGIDPYIAGLLAWVIALFITGWFFVILRIRL